MEALLQKIKDIQVLVVGDTVLDHYIWGDASRISPEAPVPVVLVDNDSYAAGMAANVVLNIASLGAKAELCGHIGRDLMGNQLVEVVEAGGGRYDDRFRSDRAPTLVKTRVIVRNQQLCRVDREMAAANYAFTEETLIQAIEEKIEDADALILSDYAKGIIDQELGDRLIQFAHAHDCLVAKDPKPRRSLCLRDVDLLTPNRAESLLMADIKLEPHEAFPVEEVCKCIWQRYAPRHLVITLGAEGMVLSHRGRVVDVIPTCARQVYDVSGAGDTVIASLTLALAAGFDLAMAARFANITAGVVVGKVGTATVKPEEVLAHQREILA